jgi:hypothetical protein
VLHPNYKARPGLDFLGHPNYKARPESSKQKAAKTAPGTATTLPAHSMTIQQCFGPTTHHVNPLHNWSNTNCCRRQHNRPTQATLVEGQTNAIHLQLAWHAESIQIAFPLFSSIVKTLLLVNQSRSSLRCDTWRLKPPDAKALFPPTGRCIIGLFRPKLRHLELGPE